MRASAGLMRMYELQKVVAALPVDDLRDASALHVQTPGRMRKSLNWLFQAYLFNPGWEFQMLRSWSGLAAPKNGFLALVSEKKEQ